MGEPMKVIIDIEPMGAVRTTQKQKYVDPAAIRYANYKLLIAYKLREKIKEPFLGAINVNVLFVMPMTKKMKPEQAGEWHLKKPDLDNMIKGVFDAANKIAWKDDSQVVQSSEMKMYGLHPEIHIEITEVTQ